MVSSAPPGSWLPRWMVSQPFVRPGSEVSDDGNEERAGLANREGRFAEGITRRSDEFQLDGGQVTHG